MIVELIILSAFLVFLLVLLFVHGYSDLPKNQLKKDRQIFKLICINVILRAKLNKANKIICNLLTLSMPIDYAKCPGPLAKIAEAEKFIEEWRKNERC